MRIGIKNKLSTALTLTNVKLKIDSDFDLATLSASVVIAAGETSWFNFVGGTFTRLVFNTSIDISPSAVDFVCQLNTTDTPIVITPDSFTSNSMFSDVYISSADVYNLLLVDIITPAQYIIVSALPATQRLVFLTGTPSAKRTLIATLTVEQQAAFTSTPVQFIQTIEQLAADRLRLDQIIFRLKSGQFVDDDDSVFYALGNSLIADSAMLIIDEGGGFDELRTAGLTQAQALAVLSIYNVNLDVSKYESEVALKLINDDPTKLTQLSAFLAGLTPPLTLPPLTPYLAQVRANHEVYAAIKNWSGS